MKRGGFTLVEALVAVAVFVIVGTLAASIYVYNMRNYKYIKVEKELADDAQFVIERIAKEFQDSTIDYEEYYARNVLSSVSYGDNYGKYAERFYDDFEVNTGQNPALSLLVSEFHWLDSAATCDPWCKEACNNQGCLAVQDPWKFDELYLISGDGRYKTIFRFDGVAKLEYLKMEGEDANNDGVFGAYEYMSGFENGIFAVLSPERTKISDMRFYVSPIEDPRKAFAETDLSVQLQPHLTIYLKVEPSAANTGGLDESRMPFVEVQTTLSSRVYHEVLSYPAE